MIVKDLQLKNFRRFGEITIDFDDRLTVIVARNGQGKTSILDALTVALGTFVGAFDLGKARHIDKTDARYVRSLDQSEGEQQYPVQISARFDQPAMTIMRELTGPKNKTTVKDAGQLTDHGRQLQKRVRDLTNDALPVVAYYGAVRLWKAHKNMERKRVLSESRTLGYEDCLSPASNFIQVQQWMAKATLANYQEQELPIDQRRSDLDVRLKAIRTAVDHALADEGWSHFRYSLAHEELSMFHEEHGTLPISLLSDGVRAMISLVADLAFRCVRLNGFLGLDAPRETNGIVLIDEVDIHLHPAWQQRVIRSLRDAFPEIQFIVTTHSPQILTTVDHDNIRVLRNEFVSDQGVFKTDVVKVSQQTKGTASSDTLAWVMGIDPIPDENEAHELSQYRALIQQNLHEQEQGQILRQKLDQHFGVNHPVMLECQRLIRLQDFKRQLPRRDESNA